METQALALAEGLAARGHELLTLTTPLPRGGDPAADTTPTRYIAPGAYRRYRRAWWEACWQALCEAHQAQPFDLLLSQGAGALGYLPRAAERLGLPTAVVMHGTLGSELRNQLRGARTLRGIYRLARTLAQIPSHYLLWRAAGRTVTRWIVLTPRMAGQWRREIGAPADRFAIMPNGINTQRFQPDAVQRAAARAAFGIPAGAPLLVAAGRLEREKGFHIAIAAFAQARRRFPDAHLLIAGDGTYRAELARAAAAVDGARLLGYIPNPELPSLLAAADLFLMPSLCDEAFPLAVIEAMAAGLPVIASNVGGIPYAIAHGVTGLLAPMGDAAAWAAAIEQLLGDTRRAHAIGALAQQVAAARFSRERMIAGIERELQAIAGR